MKDIHLWLRTIYYGIFAALDIVTYEAGTIPDNAPMPYVIISTITNQENSNKSDFGNNVQILLDVVTSYPKNTLAGSKAVDLIAANILNAINSKTKFAITDSLQIVNTKKIQDEKSALVEEDQRIYRRLIRYQHLIMEV